MASLHSGPADRARSTDPRLGNAWARYQGAMKRLSDLSLTQGLILIVMVPVACVPLGHCVRGGGLIFRIGGDEFAILLKGGSPEDARCIAQRLCTTVAAYRFDHGERHSAIGASIGLARIGNPELSADALVAAADAAGYRAKRGGRTRVMAASPG